VHKTRISAARLGDALAGHATLATLLLGYNGIKDVGVYELANALKTCRTIRNDSLTSLDLNNNDISDKGIRKVAQALEHNSTLCKLRLDGNAIGDLGASELAAALRINSTLSVLWLGSNIGPEGVYALGHSLRSHPCCESFRLVGIHLAPLAPKLGLPLDSTRWGNDMILAALPEAYRLRVLSFTMALHPRLSADSDAHELDEGVVRLVCENYCA